MLCFQYFRTHRTLLQFIEKKYPLQSLPNIILPPPGLTPYRGEEVCVPRWPGELCWPEHKLLVVPSMPGRSKGRGQMKFNPWFSRLGLCGANNRIQEESTVTEPPEPMKEDHGGGQWSHRVVTPVKKREQHYIFMPWVLSSVRFLKHGIRKYRISLPAVYRRSHKVSQSSHVCIFNPLNR
jgi:hypothetical protein